MPAWHPRNPQMAAFAHHPRQHTEFILCSLLYSCELTEEDTEGQKCHRTTTKLAIQLFPKFGRPDDTPHLPPTRLVARQLRLCPVPRSAQRPEAVPDHRPAGRPALRGRIAPHHGRGTGLGGRLAARRPRLPLQRDLDRRGIRSHLGAARSTHRGRQVAVAGGRLDRRFPRSILVRLPAGPRGAAAGPDSRRASRLRRPARRSPGQRSGHRGRRNLRIRPGDQLRPPLRGAGRGESQQPGLHRRPDHPAHRQPLP